MWYFSWAIGTALIVCFSIFIALAHEIKEIKVLKEIK